MTGLPFPNTECAEHSTTPTMTKDDMLDKVSKLLALADPANGATENEIKVAFAKATELMTRYGIDTASARARGETTNDAITHRVIDISDKRAVDSWIWKILRDVCNVKTVWSPLTERLTIIGADVDVQFAIHVVNVLTFAMLDGLMTYLAITGKRCKGREKKEVINSYFAGVAEGYIKACVEGRTKAGGDTNAYALVLADGKHQRDAYAHELFPQLRKGRLLNQVHDGHAYSAGIHDGGQLDIGNTKVGSGVARFGWRDERTKKEVETTR